MIRRSQLLAVAVALTVVASMTNSAERPATTGGHPDFSGEWVLDLGRSHLDNHFQTISSGEVSIEHREPAFSFLRTFVDKTGSSTVSFMLYTDGKEVAGTEDGMPTRQILTWSGETLVFLTIYQSPRGEARNTVRYSLADDGKTLRAEESFHGPRLTYENVWVFTKRQRSVA